MIQKASSSDPSKRLRRSASIRSVLFMATNVLHTLSTHAARQINAKGLNVGAVLRAANDPQHTYPNGRYPGQRRHVRDGICVVVDPYRQQIVTIYVDQVETAPREDQVDRDAEIYRVKFNAKFAA